MRLKKAIEDKLLDVRLRDRLLTEGKITQKEIDKYLEKLEDDEKNGEEVKDN